MMHLKSLLLLAVHSSLITAAVLRRGLFARSFNQSTINDAAVQPMITDAPTLPPPLAPLAITTKQIGSVPAAGSGSGAAKIDEEDIVSANTEPPEPLNTSKQIGIVPAVGSGPGAATLPAGEVASANPGPLVLSSTAFPSATSSSSSPAREGDGSVATASKQIGIVPAVGSGPGAATLPAGEVASANPEPLVLSSTAFPSATSSSSSPAREGDDSVATASKQIGIVPAVGSGPGAATLPAAEVASANTEPPQPFSTSFLRRSQASSDNLAAPAITNTPVGGNSNAAMAQTFNQFFDTMNANSACNPGIETQRMVCIDKKTGVCGADGKYTLSACSQNEVCRAVPLNESQTGIAIKCVPESDTSPQSQSESAAQSKTIVSAVSPSSTSSSLETKPSSVVITTQTIVVTPIPQTTDQAEPTRTKSVVSGVLSFLASLANSSSTVTVATPTEPLLTAVSMPTQTKSVVSGMFSFLKSLENGLPTAAPPKPTITKSVVSGMLSFLASLEKVSPTPTNFLTVATPTSSDVPPPPEPPQETPPPPPPPSSTTPDQPAIVIEPQTRKDGTPTDCPDPKLKGCFVVHG